MANFANEVQSQYIIGFPASGQWKLRFNSDWHGYSELFDGSPSNDIETVEISRDTFPFQSIGIHRSL